MIVFVIFLHVSHGAAGYNVYLYKMLILKKIGVNKNILIQHKKINYMIKTQLSPTSQTLCLSNRNYSSIKYSKSKLVLKPADCNSIASISMSFY